MKLFDGKSVAGWKPLIPGQPLGWFVKDGILANQPPANNLVSERKFWNFDLHAEFRVSPQSNSGIGLRNTMERLALLYGERSALDLGNFRDGVRLVLRIPLSAARDRVHAYEPVASKNPAQPANIM